MKGRVADGWTREQGRIDSLEHRATALRDMVLDPANLTKEFEDAHSSIRTLTKELSDLLQQDNQLVRIEALETEINSVKSLIGTLNAAASKGRRQGINTAKAERKRLRGLLLELLKQKNVATRLRTEERTLSEKVITTRTGKVRLEGNLANRIGQVRRGIEAHIDDMMNRLPDVPDVDLYSKNGGARTIYGGRKAYVRAINEEFAAHAGGGDFFDTNFLSVSGRYADAVGKTVAMRGIVDDLWDMGVIFGEPLGESMRGSASKVSGLKLADGSPVWASNRIAGDIDHMLGAGMMNPSAWGSVLDKGHKFWKASVLGLFPAYQIRNSVWNTWTNYMALGAAAFNPAIGGMSGNLQRINILVERAESKAFLATEEGLAARDALKSLNATPILTDKSGKAWSFGALRAELQRSDVAFTGATYGRSAIEAGADTSAATRRGIQTGGTRETIGRAITSPFRGWQSAGIGVTKTVEQHARLVHFLTVLKETGMVAEAAASTKKFLIDYASMTGFQRNVLSRIIPFQQFTIRNLQLQVKELARVPRVVATEGHLLDIVNEALSVRQLDPDELEALRERDPNAYLQVLRRYEDGVLLLMNLGSGAEEAAETARGGLFKGGLGLGSITPYLRVPVETLTGFSLFQGRKMPEKVEIHDLYNIYQGASKPIRDAFFHGIGLVMGEDGKPYATNARAVYFIRNLPPFSRYLSTYRQWTDTDDPQAKRVLQFLGGDVEYYTFEEIERAMRRLYGEEQREERNQRMTEDALNRLP